MFFNSSFVSIVICLQLFSFDGIQCNFWKKLNFHKLMKHSRVTRSETNMHHCLCGRSNEALNLRIIGGSDAYANEFPWQALLTTKTIVPFCGATLINSLYVLTAAHCVQTRKAEDIRIQLGQHDLYGSGEVVSTVNVMKVLLHENYNKTTRINDIALVKMEKHVAFDEYIRPPCFPKMGLNYTAKTATISGWGAQHERGHLTPVLQKVTLPVQSDAQCAKFLKDHTATRTLLCAGYSTGGKDACQGDSGGPMTVRNGIKYYLIGVVSWGVGCGRVNSPGVYTRVDRYFGWIKEHTTDALFC